MTKKHLCFKPYKGVSSNKLIFQFTVKSTFVSNPIREYLQMLGILCIGRLSGVSNPIREYLQIISTSNPTKNAQSFKPYKGVSSNKTKADQRGKRAKFQTL